MILLPNQVDVCRIAGISAIYTVDTRSNYTHQLARIAGNEALRSGVVAAAPSNPRHHVFIRFKDGQLFKGGKISTSTGRADESRPLTEEETEAPDLERVESDFYHARYRIPGMGSRGVDIYSSTWGPVGVSIISRATVIRITSAGKEPHWYAEPVRVEAGIATRPMADEVEVAVGGTTPPSADAVVAALKDGALLQADMVVVGIQVGEHGTIEWFRSDSTGAPVNEIATNAREDVRARFAREGNQLAADIVANTTKPALGDQRVVAALQLAAERLLLAATALPDEMSASGRSLRETAGQLDARDASARQAMAILLDQVEQWRLDLGIEPLV